MDRYFVDTAYLIALESKSDQYHEEAKLLWQKLSGKRPELITSSYILDEVTAYFTRAHQSNKAILIGDNLMNSTFVNFIHVDKVLFSKAWDHFKKYQDKEYSLTDCISFVIMNDLKITNALTFDKHFEQAGFQRLPK